MEIIYLLIPLSVVLVSLVVGVFFWATHSGQFEDLKGPSYRLLQDDDGITASESADQSVNYKQGKREIDPGQ